LPALGALEKFLHDDPERTPTLIKAGLAHAQFETIHPFLDGNGRIGRLLIALLFVAEGVLAEPLLYVSLYFKQHQTEYYDRLQRIRTEGDWEGWMSFYLAAGLRAAAATCGAGHPIGRANPVPQQTHGGEGRRRAREARYRTGDHGQAPGSPVRLRPIHGRHERGHDDDLRPRLAGTK
jgi:hypothetical protein